MRSGQHLALIRAVGTLLLVRKTLAVGRTVSGHSLHSCTSSSSELYIFTVPSGIASSILISMQPNRSPLTCASDIPHVLTCTGLILAIITALVAPHMVMYF